MEIYEGASYRINIEGLDSTLIVDSYRGTIKANLIDNDEFVIVDYDSRTFYGELSGNVTDALGNVILDSEQALLKADVVGNILTENGDVVYDIIHNSLTVDTVTVNGTINGTLIGNFTGDILNADLGVVYDSQTRSLHVDEIYVENAINGNLVGSLLSKNGFPVYNVENNTIEVDEIVVKNLTVSESLNGILSGTFVGDVVGPLGDVILDANDRTVFVNFMQGDILSQNKGIAYDSETNTFYGNFNGPLVSDVISIDNLKIGETNSGTVAIFSNKDIEDDYTALSIYNYKTSDNYSSITLTRGRGTNETRLPVEAGDKLNAILFSAQSSLNDTTPVALFGAKVPDDANVSSTVVPGEVSLFVNSYENEFVEGFTVDANGRMKTVIKDLTVIGNTSNLPNNNAAPDSWLEISVNGNRKFIPLYS